MDDINLAASVSSRICHDLVSPVGAVVNGVDLVREMGAAEHSEAIGMIGQSAERASALLQLYRIAFGTAEAEAQGVARGALADHSAVLFAPPRIVLEWQGREGPALPRREARLLTLLLLCGRSILGVRGSILLRTASRTALPLSLEVMADSLSSSAELLPLLEGGMNGGEPISPRAVEFVLAHDAARELNVRLDVVREPGRITISAAPRS
jgi:histidine phosphotransferase ChpT